MQKVLEDEMGIELSPSWSPFQNLFFVAEAATIMYNNEKKQKQKQKQPLPADTCQHRPSQRARSSCSKKQAVPVSVQESKGAKRPTKIKVLLKNPSTGALDISKGERQMREMSDNYQKPVADPVDHLFEEERLKREKLPVKKSAKKRVHFECDNSEEKVVREKKTKKIKINIKNVINSSAENRPDLPKEFKNCIEKEGGYGWKLVIQKKLYTTDLSKGHNRISMPLKQVLDKKFLTDEEKTDVDQKKSKFVDVIGTKLDKFRLCFKKWDMVKASGKISSTYVLNNGWNSIVSNDELKQGITP
ncbi:hypothetical protein F0562_010248 [Nyssa sinensis]|uniref:TF-B3 domain-containing protein n=1 Tax=Nyssa sinensis TaxID=561372 RepID=A0A5J4ZYB7_9ASTE|nr:hypothetical protein F0562_010248 [Nyssa sinensis]